MFKKRKNSFMTVPEYINNEKGSSLVMILLIMGIITIIGLAASKTSTTELKIVVNNQVQKMAFYAAEAGISYIMLNPAYYGNENLDSGIPINFPANDSSIKKAISDTSSQSYNGLVEYLESSAPPRGSGFQVGKFKAHRYQLTSNGFGPKNAQSDIEVGFYRIGF
jgi:hypothetical protein